jgi:hypothetical protein
MISFFPSTMTVDNCSDHNKKEPKKEEMDVVCSFWKIFAYSPKRQTHSSSSSASFISLPFTYDFPTLNR